MPISDLHRCIFIHIPKTGGTSLETAFDMFGRWQEENTTLMFGQIQSKELLAKGWNLRFLQHLSWNELEEILPEEKRLGYFSFSWIRNPWDRLVSIFFNKDPDMLEFAAKQGLDLASLDFKSFLFAIQNFEHVHLRPQYEFIFDVNGIQQVDFIGQFERFNQDFTSMCAALQDHTGTQHTLILPHKNASTHRFYREYYDNQTRHLVAKRYKMDIEKFGYTF
jgi:hypothetical protein